MKKILAIIGLFFINLTFSQNFSGKILYKSITKKIESEKNRNSDFALQFVKQALKGNLENEFTLEINLRESIYKKEDKLATPSIKGGIELGSFDSNEKIYKNIESRQLIIEKELFGRNFLIKDSLSSNNWVLFDEIKKVGNFLCKKASFKKKLIFGSIFTEEKTVEIIAWYCPKIPVSNGPGEFWGLPGLILEVETEINILVATNVSIDYEKNATIRIPTKGQVVTKEKYLNITEKKIKELEESFKN